MQDKIIPFGCYYVRPEARVDIGFEVEADKDNAPISGVLIKAAKNLRGRPGDRVLFQYNVYNESQWIGKALFIDPDMIYFVGNWTHNRWVLVNLTGDGMGEVAYHPQFSYIGKGDTVLFPPDKSHQLELPLYNTLNEGKWKSLVAVKYHDILMYAKK